MLLVDDSPVNLAVGSKLLHRMGCEVESVSDGGFAVTCFEERLDQEPFDLILMDLMMPTVSGMEATRKIRTLERALAEDHPSRRHPVPIIAISALEPADQRDDCLEAGMNDFQSKPFQADAIRQVIDQWLQTEEPVGTSGN